MVFFVYFCILEQSDTPIATTMKNMLIQNNNTHWCSNILVVCAVLAVWLGALTLCYATLQNEKAYSLVSGSVKTYDVTLNDDGSKEVSFTKRPFNKVENQSLLHWDAFMYHELAQYLYDPSILWVGYFAFFPLFPLLWRATQLSPIGICLLNYILFGVGLLLLLKVFQQKYHTTTRHLIITCMLLLCMPYMVVFLIPYSEALFFVCIAIGLYGLLKERYWLYFLGFTLGCTTRAASNILLVAWVIADILAALYTRQSFKLFVRSIALHLAPIVTGVAAVMLFQHFRGAEHWFEYVLAQQHWGKELSLPTWPLTDWSTESKCVTQPLLYILFVPALAWLAATLIMGIRLRFGKPDGALDASADVSPWSLVRILSVLFLVGNIVLALFTQKGCMYSQARLLTCTPFFFFLMIDIYHNPRVGFWRWVTVAFIVLAAIMCRMMLFRLATIGCALTILLTVLVFFGRSMNRHIRHILLGLTWALNIFWTAYLFNCFLSNSWIFT